ncbi:AGAP009041-PA, partial [Anopheles gambiae str. PEST]
EMTQTSLPIPVLPKPAVVATEQLQDNKVSGASTTTASNYSDDFEHQSQTEAPPPVPERSVNDTIAVSSTTTFSSGSSSPASSDSNSGSASSSSSSDSADSNTNNSSSLQSSSASSMDHERIDSPRRAVNHPPANATDDERKAKSNTTTAHSSDFDSRSFSLSDSHNNTMNNQPPQPEEYLPSFEESLRRRQLPPMGHQNDGFEKRSNENEKGLAGGEQNVSQDSSISEQLPPEDREEEQSFSFNHSEKANDLKVNAVPPMVSNLSEDSIKKDLPQVKNDTLPYEENLDATINSDLLAAMFNRTDLEEKLPDGVATSEEHDLEMSDATSISIAQSLEDVSDSGSVTNTTTPTTVTPTMAIEIVEKEAGSDKNQLEPEDERSNELKTEVTPSKEDVPANQPPPTSESDYEDEEFHTKSSSGQGGTTSELAKRLATLHDELEELSETFERTPLMKSPLMATPPQALPDHPVEDQNSSEETITFDYDEDGITPPSEEPVKGEEEEQSSTSEPKEEEDQAASKIEVKLRSKTVGSDDTIVIASGTTSYSRDDHTESIATPPPAP